MTAAPFVLAEPVSDTPVRADMAVRADTPVRAGRIRLLPPEEARKIAAGEVIDRPAALVRELLDNAIDAGSGKIDVFLEGGGILKTEVIDDGRGMEREDLELCWKTHATSKIQTVADLNTAETLGFRGEALAAAAAVARLEILSSSDGLDAWLLRTGLAADDFRVSPARRTRGTSVRAMGLFDTIPARKKFLKREGAEGALCKQVFIDKALAFPGLTFRLTQDGKSELFLPGAVSFKERFALALLSHAEGGFLHEISAQGQGFSVVIVTGGPELFRHDRRRQFIFANGRRINDYSLLQALEYGVQGWFPGNTHPVGAVYIDIDPSLADFNIHPAKREVRFRDPGLVHRTISSALRDFVRRANYSVYQERKRETGGYLGAEFGTEFRPSADQSGQAGGVQVPAPGGTGSLLNEALQGRQNAPYYPPIRDRGWATGPASSLAMQALLDASSCFIPPPRQSGPEALREIPAMYGEDIEIAGGVAERPAAYTRSEAAPRLVGRLFELFILVEQGDSFYIIDQHAAHERILYDRFMSGPIPRQDLLVPIPFTTDSEIDDCFLKDRQAQLAHLGVVLDADGKGNWQIEALPADWRLSDPETIGEILALRDAGENMAEKWAATLCCHGAVKDGDFLDEEAAIDLAAQALRLPVPRCPHGRPVWKELSRLELYQAVRRI